MKNIIIPPACKNVGGSKLNAKVGQKRLTINIGHDTFKRELAVFFWKLHRGIRPTGCGKTEAFRALSKIYRNIQVADASVITPQGYKGEAKLNYFLKRLDFSSELMPVLGIDEFDKLYTESRFSTDMI